MGGRWVVGEGVNVTWRKERREEEGFIHIFFSNLLLFLSVVGVVVVVLSVSIYDD